jgi:ArsR family transcriptional regulator, arsenate/arsenite/antimonite-responsive transcriptional repressor
MGRGVVMEGVNNPDVDLQGLAEQLKTLAEPKRLLILHMLMEGVQCNCELGDALKLPPNLISHHLRVLREAGLILMERDPLDARWVYYSINREAFGKLQETFGAFFDTSRIKPRRPTCGPGSAFVPLDTILAIPEDR